MSYRDYRAASTHQSPDWLAGLAHVGLILLTSTVTAAAMYGAYLLVGGAS